MLLAAAACLLADVAFRALLPRSELAHRNEGARAFLSAMEAPDIQVIGDSVAFRGLVTSALGTDTVYVRNDTVASARPSTSYYLLKQQFADGRIPKAIILAHTPVAFDDPFTARLAGTFAYWRELPEIYGMASEWTEAFFGTLARVSYILMNRAQFRLLLLDGDPTFFLTPESETRYQPSPDVLRLERYVNEPMVARAADDPLDKASTLRDLSTFRAIAESDAYFRKILVLARQHDVQVFWMTMPEPATMHHLRQQTGFDRELRAYLAPFEQSGELTFLEIEPLVYDDYMFDDSIHPNMHATVRFSCEMRRHAETLAAAVAGGYVGHGDEQSASRTAALAEQSEARRLLAELCPPMLSSLAANP
jgi:hypothetical protein